MAKPVPRLRQKIPVRAKTLHRVKPVPRTAVKAKRPPVVKVKKPVLPSFGVHEHHDVAHFAVEKGDHGAVHVLLKRAKASGKGGVIEIGSQHPLRKKPARRA